MPQSIISQFSRAYNSPIEVNRQVATATERDAINSSVRWEGMLVYVVADGVTYELAGGISNGDWQELGGLQDAPSDGQIYGRKDGAWQIFTATFPYKIYTANVIQSSTSAPTPTILQDDTEGWTWSRDNVGLYRITPTGSYDIDKTVVLFSVIREGNVEDEDVKLTVTASDIRVASFDSGVQADGVLGISIEIRQYP